MLTTRRRSVILSGLSSGFAALLPTEATAKQIDRSRTLVIAIGSDPIGIDPAMNRAEPVGSEIIINIFDTLVVSVADNTPNVEGRLAQKWNVSPDGLHYRFTLVEGVLFHDGTPVDAQAVQFSIERTRRLNPFAQASFAKVLRIEVVDPITVDFHLSSPVPFFLSLLGQPQAAIVSPKAVLSHGEDFSQSPVGSGAFRFVQYTPEVGLILSCNTDYFRGRSALDTLVYRIITDASTRHMELERGEIDICQQNAQLSALSMSDIQSFSHNPDIKIVEKTSQILRQLEFNNMRSEGPISDIRVRRAITHAIDYNGLANHILAGTVERAYGPLPTVNWAFSPTVQALSPNYDPAYARILLNEAQWAAHKRTLSLITFEGSFWAAVATFIQANLAVIGIDVTIEQMEFPSLRARHVAGQFDLALDGREPWYNDPDAHITIGYLSTLANTAMTFRMPPNNRLDALIRNAQSEPREDVRKSLYAAIQDLILQQAPAAYLFTSKIIIFQRKEVEGLAVRSTPPLNEYWGVSKREPLR
ncbi:MULTISPECIES: ABC transporter substrate-binding protein [Acetobacter]|uniref:ABC transporter substrate-binding protein n=1 Tax=Acetobacter TaxID=434 RepID=UPI0007780488|nr:MULTISPECIES: ABC transporter substrate-binding protein [Acetobacter]KXV11076.1 hypothetical protein AD930_00420 [Acetobacter malorum]